MNWCMIGVETFLNSLHYCLSVNGF